ncbi:MAG: hypothetical protein M3301_04625, partial [Chloroflexota bacterium]|nr:hypothetical protein [Chloroflexota bacterium]
MPTTRTTGTLRTAVSIATLVAMLTTLIPLTAAPVAAASVTSAVFTGGTGTVTVGGTLYAKQAAALTLTVTTSNDTQCVDVAGAFTAHQESTIAKTTWTFSTTAPAGDGVQAVTAAASSMNRQGKCTGQSATVQGSYTLDNAGPVVTAALTPAANANGWNNTDVTVTWTATDAGSGVASGPSPASSTETANGIVTRTSDATDRLGNAGSGSVTVRIDKAKPSITATQTQNGDGTTTVTFTCSDSNSGGGEPSGIATCVADGTNPPSNSKTVAGGTTVTGTAIDRAGNTSTTSSTAPQADATPPTINHTVSPQPNGAGWNKADTTVTFTGADNVGGSGLKSCVADGTSPASASRTISTETNGTLVTGTATDNANNTAKDSVTVKLDKTAPTISASRDPATGNANGWNNTDVTVSFSCTDPGTQASGVKSCPSAVTRGGDGANQSASGTATDNADNVSAAASVSGINIDKTAPSLSGAPTTQPNANGWYNDDVAIKWSASDATSGLASAVPANSTITGEGSGLKASASISDRAGNTTTADSAPLVRIDRTAPTTGISGTSNSWTNGSVTVSLTASDNLSGVASTSYRIDGGAAQTGTSFTLSSEGDHTVSFFSTDRAGNAEAAQTAHVKIDKTAPTISHTFTPLTYSDGSWTNHDVTVTFECADQGGSGVASCTAPVTKTAEGEGQQVVGTATDGAGNTATDTAVVSIDKTDPIITAAADRAANSAGWYNDDVTVSFTASDARSGVASKTADKVLGEGANQSATGTATDKAGNSASTTLSGINVDKTAPVLAASFTSGWHTGDVVVNWSCTDPLSGPAAQPADDTVTGDGSNLSSTANCTDKAGNTATKTVSGIQIDRHAPATGISVSGSLANGWYNADVSVELSASDNLSGVKNTYYSIDGGAAQPYSAAVSIAKDGIYTLTYWSTDVAGNVEDKIGNSLTLKIDKTPPALSGAATTAPNANGWYAGDVTVHWTCSDAGSGIDGTCPGDSTLAGEGSNLSASASVRDIAGNSTSKTVSGIKIDRTDPTTLADVPDVPATGWYKAAVQVTLTANDNLSGIAATYYSVDGGAAQTYSAPFSFATEGTHDISFWSKDKAGNLEAAGAPVTLRIDTSAPTTTKINPISPDTGWFVTSGIPFAFAASDAHSGIAATYYTIDGGTPQTYGKPFTADLSDGTHTVTYWSVDIAGNAETAATFKINVDTIPPTISGSQTPAPNGFGWNNTDVNVTFSCDDSGSGIQTGI